MTSFVGIVLIVLATAVDNALLAGVLLPNLVKEQKRMVLTIVGVLLALSQIGSAAGVDYLMNHLIFRWIAIALLVWMSIRTLCMQPTRYTPLIGITVKLFLYTALGNLDNIIWLGSTLKGDRLWLIVSSLASIPIFIVIGMFLSTQIEKQRWILPLGAGMMAWAAAALFLDMPMIKTMINGLDDAPFATFHCLITTVILVFGFLIKRMVSNRSRVKF